MAMTDNMMTVLFFKAVSLTLPGLLPMVNPPTTATLLLTRGMTVKQVDERINKTTIYLFITLYITLFAGTSVLSFFGLTLPTRLAGGLVISVIGFRMLFPSPAGQQNSQVSGAWCHYICPADHGAGSERAVEITRRL